MSDWTKNEWQFYECGNETNIETGVQNVDEYYAFEREIHGIAIHKIVSIA